MVARRQQQQQLKRFFSFYRDDESLLPAPLHAGFVSYPQVHRVFRRFIGRGPRVWLQRLARGEAKRQPALMLSNTR